MVEQNHTSFYPTSLLIPDYIEFLLFTKAVVVYFCHYAHENITYWGKDEPELYVFH